MKNQRMIFYVGVDSNKKSTPFFLDDEARAATLYKSNRKPSKVTRLSKVVYLPLHR